MASTGKKLDLIPELTTHKNDYKPWPIPRHEPPVKSYQRPKSRKPARSPQIDYQSHFEYLERVPFDLYNRPDPITKGNPWKVRPRAEKSKEATLQKDHLILKIPGKSVMDLTEEDVIKNILINTFKPVHNYIYADACLKVPKPPELSQSVLINDDVRFKPQLHAALKPGWVQASKHWDCLQSRTLVDPNKTFWLKKGPEVECFSKSNVNDIISNKTKQEIRTLIEEDRLRLPFMKTVKGYQGYRQIAAKGVPLARNKDFKF